MCVMQQFRLQSKSSNIPLNISSKITNNKSIRNTNNYDPVSRLFRYRCDMRIDVTHRHKKAT